MSFFPDIWTAHNPPRSHNDIYGVNKEYANLSFSQHLSNIRETIYRYVPCQGRFCSTRRLHGHQHRHMNIPYLIYVSMRKGMIAILPDILSKTRPLHLLWYAHVYAGIDITCPLSCHHGLHIYYNPVLGSDCGIEWSNHTMSMWNRNKCHVSLASKCTIMTFLSGA